MPLQKLPVTGLDDINHRRRARETLNQILDHSFDDSRVRTSAEVAAGVTPVNYAYAPGDVRRYGAVGDGVTDDTDAIQNAIDAAGVAGEVLFPNRTYLCAGSLTGLNFQTWRGVAYELGAGTATAAIKSSLTSGTFITAGANPRFENIRFVGAITYTDATGGVSGSTATAIQLEDSATLRECIFQLQYRCMLVPHTYYVRIYGGQVTRCGSFVDIQDEDMYNLQLDGTIFSFCNQVVGSTDIPKRYVQNLKVMGCSFDNWVGGLFNSIRTASFFGSYFEQTIDVAGVIGFNSDGSFTTNTSISLFGCLIFLNRLDRFMNYSGLTKSTFVSIGNTIGTDADSGENQFYFVPPDSDSRVVMLGDYLDDRGQGTFYGSYVSDNSLVQNQLIVWPRGTTTDHANAGQTWIDGGIVSPFVTLDNTGTPSVAAGRFFNTGGTTAITAFDDGENGQTITVFADHSVTITDGGTISLAGSVSFAMNATDTLTLTRRGGVWQEVSRSDNS